MCDATLCSEYACIVQVLLALWTSGLAPESILATLKYIRDKFPRYFVVPSKKHLKNPRLPDDARCEYIGTLDYFASNATTDTETGLLSVLTELAPV